jgi:hypothetical protein
MHGVMRFTTPVLFVSLFSLAMVAPVVAHHSAAAFDTTKEQTITGTVLEYRFSNPHIYLTLNVKKPDGTTAKMEVEAGAASVLNGLGFTKDAIKVGDVVTIVGNPSRKDAAAFMLGKDLHKQDGTYVPLNIASRSAYEAKVNATASSIEGTWFPSFREMGTFLGAARRWQLTDKGKSVGPVTLSEGTQKDCIPIGEPALMFYPVASTIKVEKDRVLLDVDWMDTTRTVYMDGRAHPAASQTFLHGHSVGKWDGKTLVVETTNFKEHPQGLSTSLPSSTQKKLTERFALGEDGKSLVYSGTIEDPVYLAQPAQWSGKWEYRPGMPHSNQKCDVELARRFLRD